MTLEAVITAELTARLIALEALTSGSWPHAVLVERMYRDGGCGLSRPDLEQVLYRLRRRRIVGSSSERDRGTMWRLRSGSRVGHLCPLASGWRSARWDGDQPLASTA